MMQLHNDTACQLTLMGYLKVISHDEKEKYILVERAKVSKNNNQKEKAELFFVYIDHGQFSRINKFVFLGMLLSIQGELREIDQKIEIIAKKIDFLHMSAAGKFDQAEPPSDEYFFDKKNMAKLKKSSVYKSSLYYDALRNVH